MNKTTESIVGQLKGKTLKEQADHLAAAMATLGLAHNMVNGPDNEFQKAMVQHCKNYLTTG